MRPEKDDCVQCVECKQYFDPRVTPVDEDETCVLCFCNEKLLELQDEHDQEREQLEAHEQDIHDLQEISGPTGVIYRAWQARENSIKRIQYLNWKLAAWVERSEYVEKGGFRYVNQGKCEFMEHVGTKIWQPVDFPEDCYVPGEYEEDC
jgi:hypothetical protein